MSAVSRVSSVRAASERGTKRFPGASVRQRTARLGSTIGVEANDDWSAIGLHAIRATFDSTWALFADRVMAPTLDANEIAIVRDQFLTVARERNTQPDDAATQLADSLLYLNHPNALSPTGTPESIAALTVLQLKQYHVQQFVTSRMLLVVVGNVDRTQIEQQAEVVEIAVKKRILVVPFNLQRDAVLEAVDPVGGRVKTRLVHHDGSMELLFNPATFAQKPVDEGRRL